MTNPKNFISLIGQKFGKLTVLERVANDSSGSSRWRCSCECGGERIVAATYLNRGIVTRCKNHKKLPRAAKDYTDVKFGKLTAIERVESATKNTKWLFKCECGNEKIMSLTSVKTGKSVTCGCSKYRKGVDRTNYAGEVGNISFALYKRLIHEAKKREIEFSVSPEYLNNLLILQNFYCALSNVPIYLNKNVSYEGKGTASLDRIDSSKGYIEGNVWWVHKDINWMKSVLSVKLLQDYCYKIIENRVKTLEILEHVTKKCAINPNSNVSG